MESDSSDVTTKVDDGEGSPRHRLEEERQKMAEEFNTQRARMKELFLQKEEELRSLHYDKQQLQSEMLGLRAELQQLQTLSQNQSSEIESLQMLIHETVEASSSACSQEVRKLQTKNLELEQQLNFLSKQQASQDATLAPAALVRSLARKLGADTDPEEVAKKAHEDAELLRSLVEPLEEEIKALKEKLRSTDTQLQLQLHQQKKLPSADNKSLSEESSGRCDMCENYEKQLVAEQSRSEEARNRTRDLERALKMATEELEGARSIHEETVQAWRAERTSSSEQLERLQTSAAACTHTLHERGRSTSAAAASALEQVTALTVQREMLQEKLDTLERDNEMLIGKYTKKAMELQNEDINLPDTVEELQEHVLRLREELIVVTMGKEASEEEAMSLRRQLQHHAATYHEQTARLATTITQQQLLRQELETLQAERQQFNELGEKLHQANNKIEELLNDKGRLQNEVVELRSRISSLQLELDNSEKVQQDFVRLSQSLQIQLERIREAETEVRWQCEEDIAQCPSCQTHLNSNKHKVHCRHCGRIFCPSCLSQSVQSGPRRVPVKVCSVCYTLLQPHAKPYFSNDPPRNPI